MALDEAKRDVSMAKSVRDAGALMHAATVVVGDRHGDRYLRRPASPTRVNLIFEARP